MSGAESISQNRADATRKQLLGLPAVRTRLEFLFALLSAAGGLVLASGQGTESIAMLAVLAAAFGFVFVDWLRLFELPPIGAYLAMGGAAAYCVQDFWGLQLRGEPQMESVALLLVLVQGVLMMQHKSRRILEQLAVFCLLELVVAAIFNDAINFGLLMIPIALVGGCALSLLGVVSLMENVDVTLDRTPSYVPKTWFGRFVRYVSGQSDDGRTPNPVVSTASPESAVSVFRAAGPWSRYACVVLAPAVFVIAAAFFYVLPRKIAPSRSSASGPALVGFDDEIRLEQLGPVMQTANTALKVALTDLDNQQPYMIDESLYLRGKVLERYEVDHSRSRPVAKWVSTDPQSLSLQSKLPTSRRVQESLQQGLFDNVRVDITCESMSRAALFAVAPYHDANASTSVVHAMDRWTLSRKISEPPFPRLKYGFDTSAFSGGLQTKWIPQAKEIERALTINGFRWPFQTNQRSKSSIRYSRELLSFNRDSVPTAVQMAVQVVDSIPQSDRTSARVARQMEQFLSTDPRFAYTLKLDATPLSGVDPIEQFLSVDRRGHCQYYASALALMLRSVGVPCRLVVGYRTEEFNPIGKYYIARQLHAHAWVEALIDRDQIPAGINLPGSQRTGRYWMRLDPTPGISAADDGNQTGVNGLVNMANNIWEDYVVDMDSKRQDQELAKATGLAEVKSSYENAFRAIAQQLSDIRNGRLSVSDLSLDRRLTIGPFLFLVGIALLLVVIRRIKLPNRFRRGSKSANTDAAMQPAIKFYAQTLEQLNRMGIERQNDETPDELRQRVGAGLPSLAVLTDAFQRCRYGTDQSSDEGRLAQTLNQLSLEVDKAISPSNQSRR